MADNNYIKFKSGTLSQVTSNLGKPDTQISISTDITSIFKGDLNLTNRVIDASLFNNTLGLRKIDASGNYDSEFINMDFARPYNSGNGILVDNSTGTISLDPSYEMFEIVSTLPTANIDKNKIYLVPKQDDSSVANNIYTEYHYLGSGTWEILGDRQADIASSLKIADVSLYEYPVDDISVGDPYDTAFSKLQSQILHKQIYIPVTHAELTDLRDNGQLVPGNLYRITDYQCTTIQENTQSAGHQFDIVLLALSENKLAEEGWAMMHDNIYDVTFNDGVTKKCYLYKYANGNFTEYNIIDVETKLGAAGASTLELQVNEETKTVSTEDWASTELIKEGLTYNYFQNSNLSAWKVWYCLDNDRTRFAWADNRNYFIVTNDSNNIKYYRNASEDIVESGLYAWVGFFDGSDNYIYTKVEKPNTGDKLYDDVGDETGNSIKLVSNDGRGVIYRMIDEWGNDCPYDFKNTLFKRSLTEGELDEDNGTDTWVYTFNATDMDSSAGGYKSEDGSLIHYLYNDEGYYEYTNNKILPYFNPYGSDNDGYDGQRELNNNVMLGIYYKSSNSYPYFSCNVSFGLNCKNNTLGYQNHNNIFKNKCDNNILGNQCHNNIFEDQCVNFILKNACYSNQFKFASNDNTLYEGCYNNIIGSYSFYNTFNANSYNNKIGIRCQQNVIGQYCHDNIIGNNSTNNRIAQFNQSVSSGSHRNTIKDNCVGIVLNLNCNNNRFENQIDNVNFMFQSCSNNIFESNISGIEISGSQLSNSIIESNCGGIYIQNGKKNAVNSTKK